MGNSEIKHNLWVAITANDPERVRNLCQKYPFLINSPISDDGQTSAVTRSAFLDRPHILAELLTLGADINRPSGSGMTALMWAAARGNLECVKFLLNFGADAKAQGPDQLTATDFAVLNGYYNTASFLYTSGFLTTKTAEEFTEIKKALKITYVDYPGILMSLEKGIPPEVVPHFTLAPIIREPKYEDPVRDPHESWGEWVHRVIEFERPPMVERNSLPQALQPQNTIAGKMKIFMKLENPPTKDILIPEAECGRKVVPKEESVDISDGRLNQG